MLPLPRAPACIRAYLSRNYRTFLPLPHFLPFLYWFQTGRSRFPPLLKWLRERWSLARAGAHMRGTFITVQTAAVKTGATTGVTFMDSENSA